jgi:hypothetical protein
MKPVSRLIWTPVFALLGLSIAAQVAGGTAFAASGSGAAFTPAAKAQRHVKAPAKKKKRPAQQAQAPVPQELPPPQQSAAQQAPAVPPNKSLGSGDALPVASSGTSGLSLGAFGAIGHGFSLGLPDRKIIGAAVPGLPGAVWSDRDNDGVVDGYSYKGQYYPGTPPAPARP